jgi:predicted nucleotidyltransferase
MIAEQLTKALQHLKGFLEKEGIPYMIIGGVANAVWGRPRATYDVDLKVILGERSIAEFGEHVGQYFRLRRDDAISFAQRVYVLLIYATEQVPADLGLAFLPYEVQAIERAVSIDIMGVVVPVCAPEDLVIHKAISEREKDWLDIQGILIRQQDRLDQNYIDEWLIQFAEALERPELLTRYRALRARVLDE